MPHAELVFQEGQDREEARAIEGGHAQVLRLKRESEANTRVAEVASEFAIERPPRPQKRELLHELPGKEIAPAEERPFEGRSEGFELGAILSQEAAQIRRIGGAELRDLRFEPGQVGR